MRPNTLMTNATTNTTVTAEQLKLFACPTCALYCTGRHAVDGVEAHVWQHYTASTAALIAIYATGDYNRFYRAVLKAKAIRGHSSSMSPIWHHALTLHLPAEHTDRERETALAKLPGLLQSLVGDDYRHGVRRGVITPQPQIGC